MSRALFGPCLAVLTCWCRGVPAVTCARRRGRTDHRRLNDPAIEITAKKIALAIARRRASRGARRRRYPGRDAALIWPPPAD